MLINSLKTTSKIVIHKTAETTGDMNGNKIAVKTTKVSKTSLQNNLKLANNKNDKEISNERYISPEKGQKIIDGLRLI